MRFLTTLAILATIVKYSQAYYVDDTEAFAHRPGRPGVAPVRTNECKRDILVLYDLSKSISKPMFHLTQKFLKDFIGDKRLDFSKDGSHLALEIFSETLIGYSKSAENIRNNTRIVFNFGAYETREALRQQIDNLNWERDGRGEYTETEVALKVAIKECFQKQSPQNHRPFVSDVLILITDGLPTSKDSKRNKEEPNVSLAQIKILKERGIHIITIAVGNKRTLTDEMKDLLRRMASSEKDAFSVYFKDLDSIMNQIVGASCQLVNPANCTCTFIGAQKHYISAYVGKVKVTWPEPELKCSNNRKFSTYASVSPKTDRDFGPGDHSIKYTFEADPNGKACFVNFTIVACKCPKVEPIVRRITSGDRVQISPKLPKLACQSALKAKVDGPTEFGVGKHRLYYTYNLRRGRTMQCSIPVVVEACTCPFHVVQPIVLIAGARRLAKVPFRPPVLACNPAVKGEVTSPTMLGIGEHTIHYTYNIEGSVLACDITVVVKKRPCAGKHYDNVSEVCCCGEIHSKRFGFECCGKEYYNRRNQRCCPDANVVAEEENCSLTT